MIKGKYGWLPKVLNKSMIKVLNKITSKDDKHKDRHADFANLPTLVLWMIKDGLDYPSNRCFASVCKSWHEATLSYSKDVRLCKESPPWLMIKDSKRHGRCKFISTSTGKRYNIFNCDLYCTETLFTKQGWFLLGTKRMNNKYKKSCGLCTKNDTAGSGRPLLLLNPFTNKKIELPDDYSWLVTKCRGAFTLVDGKPDLVAFAGLQYGFISGSSGHCIKLWTIRVTDHNSTSWTEHIFNIPRSWYFSPRCVVIIGQNIYIVSETSKLLVFNLSSCEWVSGRHFFWFANFYIDTKKEVLWKVGPHIPAAAAVFRLNDNCRDWEKLKVEELASKCWFITARMCYDYDNSYVVSKDISDAIFKDLVKKGYLIKENIPCHDEDDPNTITKIIEYTIDWDKRNVEWLDMPSN